MSTTHTTPTSCTPCTKHISHTAQAFIDLRAGGNLVLEELINELDCPIESKYLQYKDGQFILTELTCLDAVEYAMGRCSCTTHNPYDETVICFRDAMKLVEELCITKTKSEARLESTKLLVELVAKIGRKEGRE